MGDRKRHQRCEDQRREAGPNDFARSSISVDLGENVAEADVESEGRRVHLPRKQGLDPKPKAVIDHPVAFDGRMVAIGLDDEREKVAEVDTAGTLKLDGQTC